MNVIQRLSIAASASLVVGITGLPAAEAHTSGIHDNCTNLNQRWEHGVGKRHAHDQTTSGDPVTNFLRSTRKYNRAVNHNSTLDADHDGIACEQH